MSARPRTFLFTAPKHPGKLLTVLGVAHAVAKKGHKVLFHAHPDWRAAIEAAGGRLIAFENYEEIDIMAVMGRVSATRPPRAPPLPLPPKLRSAWDRADMLYTKWDLRLQFRTLLVRSALRMCEELRGVIAREKPDVVAAEPFSFGARYAAEVTRTKFATIASDPTFALNRKGTMQLPPDRRMFHIPPGLWRAVVDAAIPVQQVRATLGLPPQRRTSEFYSIMVSEDLHINTGIREMMPFEPAPGHLFVGPLLYEWPAPSPAPLGKDFPPGTILVTGSTMGVRRGVVAFRRVIRTMAATDLPFVLRAGNAKQMGDIEVALGPNVRLIDTFVQDDELIPYASVLLTHGGWGTVGRALRAGIPMLITPGFGPQFVVGRRLAELGLARVLLAEDLTPARLRREIEVLRNDRDMRARLQQLAARLTPGDPGMIAAGALEELAKG